MSINQDISCIIGPTAIGKSEYAIRLAEETDAEIISADAYQVYKYMDIGTAKVSLSDQKRAPHHLIDILDPDQAYNVQDFLTRTQSIIEECRQKQKKIIICGGTGMFIRAFIYQYELPKVKVNPSLRKELDGRHAAEGAQALWDELAKIDPNTAAKVHQNNKHHLLRALELYYLTQQKPSEIKSFLGLRKDTKITGLTSDRGWVIESINKRVDHMINNGLVDEVQQLRAKGYEDSLQSLKSIGYKEVIQFLKGDINHEEMVNLIKINTRRFSKQQMTWFKKIENVTWKIITQ